eukprot:3869411-Pleurochrysis_carterae.AAC.2
MPRRLRRVCGGGVSLAQIREAAHLFPPGSPCSFCRNVPFETEQQREATRKMLTNPCSSSNAADHNKYENLRWNHAMVHGNQQHELKMSVLHLEMTKVVPELLHADSLNVAMILFKPCL